MPRIRSPRPPRALAAAAAVALASAGCAAAPPADVAPDPTATLLSAPWTVEPQAADTATVETASLTAGDVQGTADVVALATSLSATVAALASPAATSGPAVAVNTAVPIAGCGVPKTPPAIDVRLVDGAPDSVRTWWTADPLVPRTFDGEVVASENDGTSTRIRAEHEGATFEVSIATDTPLRLAQGSRVNVIWHDERPLLPPKGDGIGYALYVGDASGLLALVFASTRAPEESERLLAGERGGVIVRQLRSPCTSGEIQCGASLYAAPVRFEFTPPQPPVTLSPGQTEHSFMSDVPGVSNLGIHLFTSHIRLTEATANCPGGPTWVISYSIGT